ncbi:MAG: Asp-tRNA(Asn)/Glu-tRNA(Gln) amidotransferase subunit GatA [Fusobacteria bacterium]|nr:Asp-tRNA(Asn)/Glu-tRNA(Gln) amidotransferase subunit GatA [Fusobacteriota bacterium]
MKLYQKTASELARMLRSKEISSIEITESFIERIEKTDGAVGSFISTRFDEAIKTAKMVDEKIAQGEVISALSGIPISVKDNIILKGEKTTAASKMLENYVGVYDATVVEKLKSQGVVILGKTNLDEFAMGVSTKTSYFKTSKNPLDLSRVAGGSSGGSASSIASLQAPISIGSDTGGSIRQPASYCGILGLKPTYGRVSRYGLMALGSSLDQIGAFAKNSEDLALTLNAICGHDVKDATSSKTPTNDFASFIGESVKGMKVGVVSSMVNDPHVNDAMKASVIEAIENLKLLGAEIIELEMPALKYAIEAYYIIQPAEASSNLARYDGIRYGHRAEQFDTIQQMYVKSRSEGFGKEVKRRIMVGNYVLSAGFYDAYYKKALKLREVIKESYANAFKSVDVILTPTVPNVAFKCEENLSVVDSYLIDIFTVPANLAGLPGISIPTGKIGNLYGSIQLVSNNFEEGKLLKVSSAYEKLRGVIHYPENLGGANV